jgi:Short C-terminal domain
VPRRPGRCRPGGPVPPRDVPGRVELTRSVVAWIVFVVAGLLLLLSSFAVWVDRVALNTNEFVDTSSELLEDDAIRTAVATRVVDELFGSVDVETELEAKLPKDLKSLSGPATAGLREGSYQLVGRALQQPRLQRLWALSVEQSHETLVRVLESDGETVSTEGGVVTLDLERLVLEAADRIGLRSEVEDQLPADVGSIEILRSDELDTAQDGFQLLNTLAWVLPLFTLAAFALGAWLSRDRRRAMRRIGITLLVVGVVGLVAVNVVGAYVVDSLVTETENRSAAGNAWDILSELLRASFRWLVVGGVLFLVAAWLAGSGRRAIAARRVLAPALRTRAWAYAALGVLTLILLLTGPAGDFARYLAVLTFAALGTAWIELMRTQTLQEFPDASAPELFADARGRVTRWWETRRAPAVEPTQMPTQTITQTPASADIAARLATLAELHGRGELTDEEFASAKARVLAGG